MDIGYNADGTSIIPGPSIDNIINDLNFAYDSGWIKDERTKDRLLKKLKTFKIVETKTKELKARLSEKPQLLSKAKKLEKRLFKVLATRFLKDLDRLYNRGRVDERGRIFLKEAIY